MHKATVHSQTKTVMQATLSSRDYNFDVLSSVINFYKMIEIPDYWLVLHD